ncbi:hypothetical protein NQ176_g4865 [Zarea fungicola]|uniref:Uncharacterized protein n=1 Tax=Zarea fungicola TaxID=93591 RepID=A0ACC1NDV3_9HYPO|nr:hypothetical protein NQ176_g4865 [Lecanicillium fungicola]
MHVRVQKLDESIHTLALYELKTWSQAGGRHDKFATDLRFEQAKLHYYRDTPELLRPFNKEHVLTAEDFVSSLAKIFKRELLTSVIIWWKRHSESHLAGQP